MSRRPILPIRRIAALAVVLAASLPVVAQHRHAGTAAMPGMDMPAPVVRTPAPASSATDDMAAPAAAASSPSMPIPMPMHGDAPPATPAPMHGMHQSMHPDTMAGMHAAGDPAHAPAHPMAMGRMQGGPPPADARSPDDSDGIAPSSMPGMDMDGGARFALLRFDQLEAFAGRGEHGQRWELQGWYGGDDDKLLVRSAGERSGGRATGGDLEALWSHAVAAYWDATLGVRHDLGDGPRRDWLAVGVQGLAPYRFEVEATAYAGPAGRTAARLRADYEVLFTQRLILQPELEANLYGRDDPRRGVGRGLADVQAGLRLRYEVRREFAPYVGIRFVRHLGRTADRVRAAGGPVTDRQFVAGLRFWF